MSWDSGQGGMSRDSGRVCERGRAGYSPDSGWEGGAHAQLSVHSHIGATAATACVREREGWKQQQLMEGAPLRATPPAASDTQRLSASASDTQRQADRPHSELRDAARPEHCRLLL